MGKKVGSGGFATVYQAITRGRVGQIKRFIIEIGVI